MAAVRGWLKEINMQNGTGEKRMGKNCRGAEQGMFRSIQTVGQTERYMRVFRKKKRKLIYHGKADIIVQGAISHKFKVEEKDNEGAE